MKLIKILSKKKKNKVGEKISYYKYMLNIPKSVVDESGFEEKELKCEFNEGKIVIQKK